MPAHALVTVGGRLILREPAYSPSLSGQPLGGETRRLSDRLTPHGGSLHGHGGEIPRQRVLGCFSHNKYIIVRNGGNVKWILKNILVRGEYFKFGFIGLIRNS